MSQYTFTFKKDDIFVEFTTTDKEVVEKQFQIWVANADAYVRNRSKKSSNIPVSNPILVERTENSEQETEEMQRGEDAKRQSEPDAKEFDSRLGFPAQQQEAKIEETVEQQPEILDTASTLLKTINTIQGAPAETNEEISVEEKPAETTNFEEVLEKTIENPTFEPEKTQDQVFLNLIKSKNTTDKFHYLIITAYYLLEFEKLERFSLKQINAKLMQNLSEVIDHITLQEAINQNLIELVPDLTGTSEVGEYRLTPAGEDFFANKI